MAHVRFAHRSENSRFPYTRRIRHITVRKLGHDRQLIFSWDGDVLEEDSEKLVLRASWAREKPMFLGYTVFEPGDPFLEVYYRDRWFSVWRVESQRTGRIKGWYCNICQPAEFHDDRIDFVDMELDLFLFPDGRYCILDEDDLEQAPVAEEFKDLARAGLEEVIGRIEARQAPFDCIGPPRRIDPFWE